MPEGGESALVAQQKIAAEEPYKNIEQFQQGLQGAVNAWQVGASIADKRRQLEQQMMALQQRNAQFEYDKQFDKQKFGLDVLRMQNEQAWRRHQAGDDAIRLDLEKQRIGIEDRNSKRSADVFELRNQQYEDNQEAQTGLAGIETDLDNEGYVRGTVEWQTEYNHRAAPFLGKLRGQSFNAQQRIVLNNQQQGIFQKRRNDALEMKSFQERVGSELYNNAGVSGLQAILEPNSLPDYTESTGWGPWKKTTTTNKKVVPDIDAGGVKVKGVPTSAKRLTELNKEYQQILANQAKTGRPMHDPSRGLYQSEVKPMPADKSLMEPGLYNVPGKGTMRWTGTGFVPPDQ